MSSKRPRFRRWLDGSDLSWARRLVVVVTGVALLAVACSDGGGSGNAQTATTAPVTTVPGTTGATAAPSTTPKKIDTIPGMPGVPDPSNLYSETAAGKMSDAVKSALAARLRAEPRVEHGVGDRPVDDEGRRHVRRRAQPAARGAVSWDLKTLWVTNNAEGTPDGIAHARSTRTRASPARRSTVDDPYNMYFTPDGKYAINVAEARKRLDFLDPHTMKVESSLDVPDCAGVNHADFTIDGRYVIFTCEFAGQPGEDRRA